MDRPSCDSLHLCLSSSFMFLSCVKQYAKGEQYRVLVPQNLQKLKSVKCFNLLLINFFQRSPKSIQIPRSCTSNDNIFHKFILYFVEKR